MDCFNGKSTGILVKIAKLLSLDWFNNESHSDLWNQSHSNGIQASSDNKA